MKKTLPIYDVIINENDETSGIFSVALVDRPAIQTNFLMFSEDKQATIRYADEEKRILSGILLRPDFLVYRNTENYGECFWRFTKESIEQVRDRYHKMNMTANVNLMHQYPVEDCYLVESYIINKERGICPKEFSDIEDGSWYVSFKIENDELWNGIKDTDIFKGFSVEGSIFLEETDETSDINYNKTENKNNINKINELNTNILFKTINDLLKNC